MKSVQITVYKLDSDSISLIILYYLGNEHSFSSNFINSIKRRRMSDLLCDNTFIRNVNTNAFLSTSDTMDCSQTNSLDFGYYNLLLLPTSKYNCINDSSLSLLGNFIQTFIMSKMFSQSFCVQKSVQQAINTNEEM